MYKNSKMSVTAPKPKIQHLNERLLGYLIAPTPFDFYAIKFTIVKFFQNGAALAFEDCNNETKRDKIPVHTSKTHTRLGFRQV